MLKIEINFLRTEKLSRRDYLDYLKYEAKSGDMVVFEIRFRNISSESGPKIGSATGVRFVNVRRSTGFAKLPKSALENISFR